jgi:forespore regulator of the sigma-K checkpoint
MIKGVILMRLRIISALLLVITICFGMSYQSIAQGSQTICDKKDVKDHQVMGPLSVKTPKIINVHLKTLFMDGVSIVNVVDDHFISLDSVVTKYEGFHLAKCSEKNVFLFKKVDDLSPVSKTAGIFGLKDGKILTLYKGDPDKNQIIQTFFQIDVNALEADAFNHLRQGIRISDKNQYIKVIQSFSKYTVKPTVKTKS